MVLIRRYEDHLYRLFLQGQVPGTLHQCQRQEAVAVGVCSALRPDDSVLLAWRGREATLHELAGGTLLARLEHPDAVKEGHVLPGRAVLTRDAAGGVWLWGGGGAARALAPGGMARIATDDEGRRALGWGDDGLRLWDLPGGEPRGHLLAGTAIAGAAFLDGGKVLAWNAAGQFWRLGEAAAPASWQAGCATRGVEVAVDGRTVLSFCDSALVRHDATEGKVAARWTSPELVDGVHLDAEAGLVVSWSAGRGRVRVWQAVDGAPRRGSLVADDGRALDVRRVGRAPGSLQERLRMPSAGAATFGDDVAGDAEEPDPERGGIVAVRGAGPFLELVQVGQRGKERPLGRVLRLVMVAQLVDRDVVHLGHVLPIQGVEAGGVRLGGLHEGTVAIERSGPPAGRLRPRHPSQCRTDHGVTPRPARGPAERAGPRRRRGCARRPRPRRPR